MKSALTLNLCMFAVGAVALAGCAPATGLSSLGNDHYALTAPAVKFEPIKPLEEKLVAQAKATCAQQQAQYHYVQTHIKHPTGYGPHYTLEFECQKQAKLDLKK